MESLAQNAPKNVPAYKGSKISGIANYRWISCNI